MPPSDSAPASCRRDLAWLALCFGLLYFFQLGDTPLANPDESRYAEIPREMIATGDYVLPRLNGVLYFEKPPLVYWSVAGFLHVFGPDEMAMRATPALFALAGVLLTYATARRMYGRLAGLWSAMVLGTALLYFGLARILILDMAVSVLMSAALFCFILGVREAPGARRRGLFYGLYVCAALATLTKGLIGFLVTGAIMFLWLLIFNQWRRLRPFYLPTGALIFLAIAAPWHLLAASRNDIWAHFYFIREHWERFTTTGHDRYEPWWYFLPVVLGGLFPWMGFLWPATRAAIAGGWARRKDNADAWFFVLWAAFVFLFFSKSQSKLIPYILPIFPAVALLIGPWLARLIQEDNRARLRPGLWIFAAAALVLGCALIYAVFIPGIIRRPEQMEALRLGGCFSGLCLIGGALVGLWIRRRQPVRTTLLVMVASVTGLLLTLAHSQDIIARAGTRDLALAVQARAKAGDRIFHYGEYFHDFSFYAQREVGLVGDPGELEVAIDPTAQASGRFITEAEFPGQWTQAGRIWLVARKDVAAKLMAEPAFRYYLLGESRSHYLLSNQP